MKTLDERLEDLQAEHEKAVLKIKQETAILTDLEKRSAPLPRMVHLGGIKTYGYTAHITYGDYRNPATAEEVAAITEAIPPVKLAYAADGSYKYFLPHDADSEIKTKESTKEFFEIFPYYFKIDSFECELVYFADVAGQIVQVSIRVSDGMRYGKTALTGRVIHYGGNGPIARIDERGISHDGRQKSYTTLNITNENGDYCGETARPIQYASGSAESWHSGRIWAHIGSDSEATAVDFLRVLREGEQ